MISDLYEYQGLQAEQRSLQYMIEAMYYNLQSVKTDGETHTPGPSDPTYQTTQKIAALKRKEQAVTKKLKRIEREVDQIQDAEIRGIIRIHFFAGKSWRETARIIYPQMAESTPRMRFKAWQKNQYQEREKKNNDQGNDRA